MLKQDLLAPVLLNDHVGGIEVLHTLVNTPPFAAQRKRIVLQGIVVSDAEYPPQTSKTILRPFVKSYHRLLLMMARVAIVTPAG